MGRHLHECAHNAAQLAESIAARSATLSMIGVLLEGFEELPHTADCAIRVWAPDLESLLAQAALGLNHVAGVSLGEDGRTTRQLVLEAEDYEGLLVAFLTELVYYMESENLAFDRFEIQLGHGALRAILGGAPIASLVRPVKAVTFHDLAVQSKGVDLETTIVFDV